jgi:MFS family permease
VERKWWTLLASCIAIFMLLLDVTIVNVALPSIERDLGANFSEVDALSWRWVFLVNVPIGLAALVVTRLRLRESRDRPAAGVDLRGVALLCPALFLLVYALISGNEEGWGSALIISCFAASAVQLALFVVVETRTADPLLDLSLFR